MEPDAEQEHGGNPHAQPFERLKTGGNTPELVNEIIALVSPVSYTENERYNANTRLYRALYSSTVKHITHVEKTPNFGGK